MKKLYLEFIRGAAALTVLFYHFLELHTLSNNSKHFYFANWGTDAVIIFFILSGIVINISQSNNPKPGRSFMANRLLRIYPQLVFGLILGLLALYITGVQFPSFRVIAGNFLMISAIKGYMVNIVPCLQSNSPLWSLSYEIVFYLIFAMTIGRYQKKAMLGWFILSLAIMPVYYLQIGDDIIKHFTWVIAFSSIWLAGYFIYEYRSYFYADKYAALFSAGVLPLISRMHLSPMYYDPAKYLLFAIFAAPFFRYCLRVPDEGKKIKWYYLAIPYLAVVYVVFKQPYLTFGSFAAYSALPVVLTAISAAAVAFKVKDRITGFIERTGRLLGKYSYSIYITHYPVLFCCAAIFHSTGLNLLVSLSLIGVIAWSLENYLQPAVVSFFKRPSIESPFAPLLRYNWDIVLLKKIILPFIGAITWLLLPPFGK